MPIVLVISFASTRGPSRAGGDGVVTTATSRDVGPSVLAVSAGGLAGRASSLTGGGDGEASATRGGGDSDGAEDGEGRGSAWGRSEAVTGAVGTGGAVARSG